MNWPRLLSIVSTRFMVGVVSRSVSAVAGLHLRKAGLMVWPAGRMATSGRYPHDLRSGKGAPDAVDVLRKVLAEANDGSVVIAQVGFSTNLANLLSSPADSFCPMDGTELVRKKVRLLSDYGGSVSANPGGRRQAA